MTEMTEEEWFKYGWEKGFCSAPHCYTHDGLFMSPTEEEIFDEGSDPCIHIIRLYDDPLHGREIEENNSPAYWRASNLGWRRDA